MKKLVKVFFVSIGIIGGAIGGSILTLKTIKIPGGNRGKFKAYYDTTNQWLMLKNEGKCLENYFIKNEYKTVAIYGMGEMGNRLYEELRKSEKIEVKYAIDENSGYVYSGEIEVILPDEEYKPVDVIVVTPLFDFDNIQDKLNKKINCPIISLEEVVFDS